MAELLITVQMIYFGDKARLLVPGYTSQEDVITTLRADLTALRSPHPKKDEIALHSVGRIVCSWRTQDYNVCGLFYPALAFLELGQPIAKKLRQISKEQDTEPLYMIKEQQSM
jgi:hypothetical protein